MPSSSAEREAVRDTAAFEHSLGAVEAHLAALGLALQAHDPAATELAATDLHGALSQAVSRFGDLARRGGVPPALRRRLAMAGGQVAAQRDAVSRATSMLDRAIDILLPAPNPSAAASVYGAHGLSVRPATSGVFQA